jgi:Leucine-rich repeat (LRR) protein
MYRLPCIFLSRKLSLSTNMIERLSNLNSLKNLKILSVGRNFLKSLVGVVSLHFYFRCIA